MRRGETLASVTCARVTIGRPLTAIGRLQPCTGAAASEPTVRL